MRLTLATPLLLTLLALAGCGPALTAHPGTDADFPPTCAEQSAWATQGRTDGGSIRITCP